MKTKTLFSALVACLTGVFVASAQADMVGQIEVGSPLGTMTLDSNSHGMMTPIDTKTFQWTGSMTNMALGWGLDWDLTISSNPSISGVSGFTNMLGSTANFTFNVTSASSEAIASPFVQGASIITVLDTGSDGATMAPLAGGAIYDAFIESASQKELFLDSDGFALVAGAGGVDGASEVWGPQASTVPLNMGDTFGINHSFSLTAGDQATVNSSFKVIPAPAALALLGLGGLMTRRRRR